MYRCYFIVNKYVIIIYTDAKINTATAMNAIYALKRQVRTLYGLDG